MCTILKALRERRRGMWRGSRVLGLDGEGGDDLRSEGRVRRQTSIQSQSRWRDDGHRLLLQLRPLGLVVRNLVGGAPRRVGITPTAASARGRGRGGPATDGGVLVARTRGVRVLVDGAAGLWTQILHGVGPRRHLSARLRLALVALRSRALESEGFGL